MRFDMSRGLAAGILGAIAAIVAFNLFGPAMNATDEMYLMTINSCEINGNRFTTAYQADATDPTQFDETSTAKEASVKTKTDCSGATLTVTGWTVDRAVLDEHGEQIGTVTAATTITWDGTPIFHEVLSVMRQFSGITKLIMEVLPVLATVGFLGITANKLYQYAGGDDTENLQSIIAGSLGTLLLIIVVLEVSPAVMTYLDGAFRVVDDGRLSVTRGFSGLIVLIFGFIPVIFVAGLLVFYGKGAMPLMERARNMQVNFN